jgi:hypothetical protein
VQVEAVWKTVQGKGMLVLCFESFVWVLFSGESSHLLFGVIDLKASFHLQHQMERKNMA